MEDILREKMVESVDEVKKPEVLEEQEATVNGEQEPTVNEEVKPKTRIGAVVDCKLLNVRREANGACEILTRIKEGETVRILDEDNGFYKVQTNKGIIGFCMCNYINLNL